MSDDLENVNFSRYSLDIGLVFDLVLLQYFDCHLLTSYQVRTQSHLSERTLSKRSTYAKQKS